MDVLQLLLLAIGVAMDAFAVSICKGIMIKKDINKSALIVGSWFGTFQGLMPLIGYFIMSSISDYIQGVKELIIFALLLYVGIAMILESKKEDKLDGSLNFITMFILAIATSLDALSIGMSLSLLNIHIFICVLTIAIITFIFSFIGVKIGNKFGDKYKSKAELIGGIVLILIGVKVILEYLIVNI